MTVTVHVGVTCRVAVAVAVAVKVADTVADTTKDTVPVLEPCVAVNVMVDTQFRKPVFFDKLTLTLIVTQSNPKLNPDPNMQSKTVLWIELTSPWEENLTKKHFEKIAIKSAELNSLTSHDETSKIVHYKSFIAAPHPVEPNQI